MSLKISVVELSPILIRPAHSLEIENVRAALGIEDTARRFAAL